MNTCPVAFASNLSPPHRWRLRHQQLPFQTAATSGRLSPHWGTFFKEPSGRPSDGRLIIDLIAEHFGLPYLNAFLDSVGASFRCGASFRHGANFAVEGATIRPLRDYPTAKIISLYSLEMQLLQFSQFKVFTQYVYNESEGKFHSKRNFPRPGDFTKALFTLDIGSLDLSLSLVSMPIEEVRAPIPKILSLLSIAVEELYYQGAREFLIHNIGPMGCLPLAIKNVLLPRIFDQIGCVKTLNDIIQEFNRELKFRVTELRQELPYALLTYVDIYSAKYRLTSDAHKQGFIDPFRICCGHFIGETYVGCGVTRNINGTEVTGSPCGNPSIHVYWDGAHYTEAANRWVFSHIINGSLSDPQLPVSCL
ncbi:GDSL esterase/lipase At5g14450-like isoform X2 [Tasmannia lanceolata]|uniref:GDSL esterase/lipase At5g14450-like isoform X2 n=1 Tax=Tasmannia lanceolata TaxID=3420 RepID=UPI00406457A2